MAYDDAVLALSPDRYWRLGDAVSSTQFVDETGNIAASSTVVSGATFGTSGILPNGDADTCPDFDGNDYLTVADSTNPTSLTVTMWVRPDVDPVSLGLFASANGGTPVGGTHSHDLFTTAAKVVAVRVFDGGGQVTTGTTALAADTTYFIAFTVTNSGSLTLYVNGQSEGTPDSVGTVSTGMTHYWIGVESQNNTFMSGKIDEVAIWHSVLTAQNIEDLYDAGVTGGASSILPLVACDMRNMSDMGGMRG